MMGIGGAFIMPATLSIITSVFTDPIERTKAIGLWSAVSGLGVAIGPVAGGWLLAHFSWDSIFLDRLPIVAIALVAGHWLVPASRAPQARRLDLIGAALSVAAFTALTYTIIEAPANGWLSAMTLGLGAASVALLAAFAAREARTDHPMLPLRLFRNPRFGGAGVSIDDALRLSRRRVPDHPDLPVRPRLQPAGGPAGASPRSRTGRLQPGWRVDGQNEPANVSPSPWVWPR